MPEPRKEIRRETRRDYGEEAKDRALEIFFLILILAALVSSVGSFFRGGGLSNYFNQLFPKQTFASINSPIGGSIKLSGPTEVFSADGTPIGSQDGSVGGKITDGPKFINGERYWFVDFDSGPDGWAPESKLLNADGRAFDPGDTPIGSEVETGSSATVYGSPGGSAIGAQAKGAKGVVTDGPKFINGERYWFVDFDSGPDGWVKESALRAKGGGPFRPRSAGAIVGSDVFTNQRSAVYDSPGGNRTGTQSAGAKGVITEGPMSFGGKRYWYVDFGSGHDGWVLESNLEIINKESALSSFGLWIGRIFKFISTVLSLLFLSGIIYSVIRRSQISSAARMRERHKEGPTHAAAQVKEYENRRWENVIAHVQSDSPSDWRLAILEADIVLAELLGRMGYAGENVGEKLKTVEQSDFGTIEDAWEAHKIRNLIAHQGSDYVLSKREAQRVIGLYSNVFREFRYI